MVAFNRTDNALKTFEKVTDTDIIRRTQMETFRQCMRRGKAELLGEGKKKPSRALITGTLCHQGCEGFMRGAFEVGDADVFEMLVKEGLSREDAHLFFKCLKTLEGRRPDVVAIEHEFTFKLLPDAPAFQVHFDLVTKTPDGYRVTDYKTDRVFQPVEVWKTRFQPMAYTLAASLCWPGKEIEFEIIYMMLGQTVRWKPDLRQCRAEVTRLFQETWAAIKVFNNRGEWPETLNEYCGSCCVRNTCKTVHRAHTEFLTSLMPEEEKSLVDRYLHAQHVLKSIEAKVNDLRLEVIEKVQAKGGQMDHDGLRLYLYNGKRRELSYSDLATAVAETLRALPPDRAAALQDRCYDLLDSALTVKVGMVDTLLGEFPELNPAVEAAMVTTQSETPTLRVTGTNKR